MTRIDHPPVVVLHSLPGRIRLGLPTLSPGEAATMEKALQGADGITSVRANPVSKTVLILSDSETVAEAEVVRKVLLHLRPVQHCAIQWLTEGEEFTKGQELKQFLLSGALLGGALVRRLFPRANASTPWLDYAAAAATGYTVVQKAVQEIREEDGLSLDTFSIIYMLLSAGTEKLLSATIVTWLANFGHILFAHPHHRSRPDFQEILGATEGRKETLAESAGWASVAATAATFIVRGRQARPPALFDSYRQFNQRYQGFL